MKNLTKGGYSVEKPHFQHYLYSKTSLNQKQVTREKNLLFFRSNAWQGKGGVVTMEFYSVFVACLADF